MSSMDWDTIEDLRKLLFDANKTAAQANENCLYWQTLCRVQSSTINVLTEELEKALKGRAS